MNPWDKRFERDEYIFGKRPADALVKLEHHLVPKGRTLVFDIVYTDNYALKILGN